MAQSSEILAFLTTSAKRAESASRACDSSAALAGQAWKPKVSKRLSTAGDWTAAAMPSFSCLRTGAGVPLGTNAATQVFSSKSFGPPASATVGTSGYEGSRAGAASASSLTRLAWYRFCTVAAVPKAQSTSPLATAV